MTKQVGRSQLIDQLQELKQGLSDILSDNNNAEPAFGGYDPGSQDGILLGNYQILSLCDAMVNSERNPSSQGINNQGNQSIILLDTDQRIIAYNLNAENSFNYLSGKQLKAKTALEDYLPQCDLMELKDLVDQASKGINLHFTGQLKFSTHRDHWYEISLFPVIGSGNTITRLVWCMEDIAERRAARQNLKALEINFQSVFKQAAVGVVLRSINLEVIQANRKFYELIEYSPQEFKALPPLSITHPRDLEENTRLLDLLRSGELDSFSLEKRLVTKSGKVVWVYITTNIIKDPKGKPKLIISVAQDVTDRKYAEQELIFKSNELDTFIYRASHDLRGPVASLMGLYNVVQAEFKEDSQAMEYFEHYHRSVLRLNKILHNLIDLTKIKEKDIKPSEVDLNDIISDCLASISKAANFEKIHFKLRNDLDFKLQTDVSSIRTILFHLLENAVNFIQKDNSQPFIKLEIKYESSFLIIEVTDNGQGIKKELQSQVFNMFYRANEGSSGSGLGLYIVRYAVEKLNGSIQLKSKEFSGTKISVYIPYSSSSAISSSSASSGSGSTVSTGSSASTDSTASATSSSSVLNDK